MNIIVWQKFEAVGCCSIIGTSGLEHGLLTPGAYLPDGSVFHLVDALVEGVFGEIRLPCRNALAPTPLDLPVAAVYDVDVRCAHVDRLRTS